MGLLWRVCTAQGGHRGDGQRNCRRDCHADLSAATDAATIARRAKTHGNRAVGREFDCISEANNTTSVFVDVQKIDWRRFNLPRSKMPQRGQAAAFPELERQLVE